MCSVGRPSAMDMKKREDRCTTTKLLEESIIQLCRVTAGLSGNVMVDGIVCICSDDEPHQIVVKIHERLQLINENVACDPKQHRGCTPDVSLVNTESQEEEVSHLQEVASKSDDERCVSRGRRCCDKTALGQTRGEQSYECGVCSARFVAKCQLVSHVRKLHHKPMSHFCHTCHVGLTDGMSHMRHRYSPRHRQRVRLLRRSRSTCQRRPHSRQCQCGSRSVCEDQCNYDAEDSGPTATSAPAACQTNTDGLTTTKGIPSLLTSEYIVCINQCDDKPPGRNIHSSERQHDMVHHTGTESVVCEPSHCVHEIKTSVLDSRERSEKSSTSTDFTLDLVKKDTKKKMIIECQAGDDVDYASEDNVIDLSSSNTQEIPVPGKKALHPGDPVEQFLCEFCWQNHTTFDEYVCHVEQTHCWHPCHYCPRMFKDVFERRSHTLAIHQLQALYCMTCHIDFFDSDMYRRHLFHNHGIDNVGDSWHVKEGLRDEQFTDRMNVTLPSTRHAESVVGKESVGNISPTNETTRYETYSDIKVYNISDDERSPTTGDDNLHDRQEPARTVREEVTPPQAPPHPDRTYVCAMCTAVLHGVALFEQHCMAAHGRYGCVYCEKLFTQKGNMRRHQLTHTGEKPYRCIVCGVAFKRKEQLTSHEVSSHNIVVRSQFYTLN